MWLVPYVDLLCQLVLSGSFCYPHRAHCTKRVNFAFRNSYASNAMTKRHESSALHRFGRSWVAQYRINTFVVAFNSHEEHYYCLRLLFQRFQDHGILIISVRWTLGAGEKSSWLLMFPGFDGASNEIRLQLLRSLNSFVGCLLYTSRCV